jgi:hypothetical protein
VARIRRRAGLTAGGVSSRAHSRPAFSRGVVVDVTLSGELEQLLLKLSSKALGEIGHDLREPAGIPVGQRPGRTDEQLLNLRGAERGGGHAWIVCNAYARRAS